MIKYRKYKVVVCGPSDVSKEVRIVEDVIAEWNRANSDTGNVVLQFMHWQSDTSPSLAARPQEVINRKIIDSANILVAILWSRMGSSTGLHDSGTEEEILRGITLRKRVMVYFSELNLTAKAESEQLRKVNAFRDRLQPMGLYFCFNSRAEFRRLFARHLADAVNELGTKKETKPKRAKTSGCINQSQSGSNNMQAGRDIHVYKEPPKIKTVLERRPGSITPSEAQTIQKGIEKLADGEVGVTRPEAFAKWWNVFKATFHVDKYESLLSSQMPQVKVWFRDQQNLQKARYRTAAPDVWRRNKYKAIKACMTATGKDKNTYYLEIAGRLKIKPFGSLAKLTKSNLERVYNLVRRDANHR